MEEAKRRNLKEKRRLPCFAAAFLANLAVALGAMLPFLLRDKGYFAMAFDFSAQEIPFNILMNRTVKSGNLLWNWAIDLGGNFLESFAFYNVGSVFNWISFLFPAEWVPRLIGWMMILKFAAAGGTSAVYLERHLESRAVIVLCSMLYAFSGFQCTSLVFYHFMDVVALFPLMLSGMEKLVEEGKRGRLALACALNVLCNYVFFVGEVIFLVLYYVVKYLIPHLRGLGHSEAGAQGQAALQAAAGQGRSLRRQQAAAIWQPLFSCGLEGLLGLLMGGALLLPAVNGTLANSRISQHLLGESWLGMSTAEILMVLKAVLMPGETMNSLSSVARANWMTNGAYLPLFGILLVLAYCFSKKDWLSALLKTGLVIAMVPVLNNAFCFFSVEGYRRWYYMLILLMALATGKVLEKPEEYKIRRAGIVTAVLYLFFVLMTTVVKWNASDDGILYHRKQYLLGLAVAVGGVCLVLLALKLFQKRRNLLLCIATALCSCFTVLMVVEGYQSATDNTCVNMPDMDNNYSKSVAVYLTEIPEQLSRDILPYRYYFDEWISHTYYNLAMAGSLPSMNSFISTVHPSVTEYYETHGTGRGTWTNAISQGARELVGVKYIISLLEEPEYTFLGMLTNSNGQEMYLYENENALPIGITFDTYMTESEYQGGMDMYRRPVGMLTSLVVKNEDEEKVSDCLEHLSYDKYVDIFPDNVEKLVEEHKKECSTEFTYGDNWFASKITADKEKYAFFSVPYDKYWKASVNGREAQVLDCNGMMAVRIDQGENEISFRYEYAPLKYGIGCSAAGVLLLAVYLLGCKIAGKNREKAQENVME